MAEALILRTARLEHGALAAGEGPLVLFLHGITAGAVVWEPVLESLADEFRCLALDQRGHGRAGKPGSGYTAQDYVDDVVAVLEQTGPARAVVGHSLGARNAILLAAQRPDLVGGVVAVDYVAGVEPEVFEGLRRARRPEGPFESEEEVRLAIRARSALLPPEAVERRARHLYSAADGRFSPLASPSAVEQTLEVLDVDLAGPLRSARVPVLAVRGERSRFCSEAALALTLSLGGHVSGAVVAGADHFVPEERPGELAALVRAFLHGVDDPA